MFIFSSDDNERTIHQNSIEVLANELQRSRGEISGLYASVLEDFHKNAKVRIFLHILARKKVKELLRQ